jgi:hypothetical protein
MCFTVHGTENVKFAYIKVVLTVYTYKLNIVVMDGGLY